MIDLIRAREQVVLGTAPWEARTEGPEMQVVLLVVPRRVSWCAERKSRPSVSL